MDANELTKIIDKHAQWLADSNGGDRANLSGAYLSGAYLSGADLSEADLSGANLSGADLSGADLSEADLSGANLSGADLSGANLSGAYLSGANLSGAYLSGAYLSGANLSGAYLSRADLSEANLSGVKANENTTGYWLACPSSGAFTGWKRCADNAIVELLIPADARRSSATGRKCRAEYVDVVAVYGADVGVSTYDSMTEYRAGERVATDKWDEDRWVECSHGIHFFISREEAEAYK